MGTVNGGFGTIPGGLSSTGSSVTVEVDPASLSAFQDMLPSGATISVATGIGTTIVPTTSAVVVGAGSSVNVTAQVDSSVLIGGNSTTNFKGSVSDSGAPVSLNVTLAGSSNKAILNKGADSVVSTAGNDTIVSSGGTDTIVGGAAPNLMVGGGRSNITGGSGGGDTIVGGLKSDSQDTIGSGGSALITTAKGQNTIYGTTNDTIRAGASQDTIFAGNGPSTIVGGNGAAITGGGQSSIIAGQNNTYNLKGQDTLKGGLYDNAVTVGGGAHAYITGGAGALDVTLRAGKGGDDTIFGGSGGLTVHVGAAFGGIKSDVVDQKDPTIHVVTFDNGQTMHLGGVTLDFGNNNKTEV